MASMIDAIEECWQDLHAVPKFVLFTIPLFYEVLLITGEQTFKYAILVHIFTQLLLLGMMLTCTYNVRKGQPGILPSFNLIDIIWSGLKCAIALAPLAIISGTIATTSKMAIATYFSESLPSWAMVLINSIIALLCAAFVTTGYILYAKEFRISDAYNFKLICKYCADIMIATLFMELQIALIDIVLIAPVAYIIWLLYGLPHPIAVFFVCFIVVINYAMIGHYLAQLDFEIIELTEEELEQEEARYVKKED